MVMVRTCNMIKNGTLGSMELNMLSITKRNANIHNMLSLCTPGINESQILRLLNENVIIWTLWHLLMPSEEGIYEASDFEWWPVSNVCSYDKGFNLWSFASRANQTVDGNGQEKIKAESSRVCI